jgi:probable HAF family extracellular repeat protein
MKSSSRILAVLVVVLGGTARADYIITDLGTFGGTTSEADAINRLGQVAGSGWLPGNVTSHASLYSNGVLQDLGTLAPGPIFGQPAQSIAAALNNYKD